VTEFINALCGSENKVGDFCEVPVVHKITLGEIADMLYSFKESRNTKEIPLQEGFSRKLYATYLSYLPEDAFSYPLKMNVDERGSFTEFLKTDNFGQVSVNVSKPHITKGNHWHHTKNEKFLVVSGKGVIRFKKIDSDEVIEYFVSGEKLEVVDIPTGYTHNIENLGDTDMVTIMWANEKFNPEKPDTYFLEV
jgi:UDP-2-acetamido-2,6-beta-L-arabino-hexul-4-ose reductase